MVAVFCVVIPKENAMLRVLATIVGVMCTVGYGAAAQPQIKIETPMSPPAWALLEREVLRASTRACQEYFAKYFDERGFLLCVERWGGDDGPDDAIECCNDWPILHALGAPDVMLRMYKKAWEGHLRQYTLAKTTHVPFARDGMYYKEFPVMMDWLHNAEGLTVFCNQGLGDPYDPNFAIRMRRFAGFYMNEDPGAPNYDPKHKIIRSMFNGSRGPLLRKATGLDWAGDPIEVENRFKPRHGENTYEQMVAHFKDYNDIVGDHPQNLLATALPLHAYMLTHEAKYKNWLLEYADAWRQRILDNGGIIPTNIGLDGTIGGATGGKWYGGVYGWGFSVLNPADGKIVHRNNHYLALQGFGNAYLLTGDDKYLDPWRKMIDKINAQGKIIDGQMMYPHNFGDKGWYNFTPEKYKHGAEELWYWSMADVDRKRLPQTGWIGYLHGKNPTFPEQALRQDLETIRKKVGLIRADTTTPDTRLSDDPMGYNPATVVNLVHLTMGGIHHKNRTLALYCRLRYFDPVTRRAGLPQDVAALIEKMSADSTEVTLVNVSPVEARTVTIQAGGYGEHQFTNVSVNGVQKSLDGRSLTIRLEPGCGARLSLGLRRYVNVPTLAMPWGSAVVGGE